MRLVAGAVGGLTIFSNKEEARAMVAAPGLMEGIAAALLLHGNAYCRLVLNNAGNPGADRADAARASVDQARFQRACRDV